MKTVLFCSAIVFSILLMALSAPKKPVTTLDEMKKATKMGYVYIPAGQTRVDQDTVSCEGFFMMKEEVSNFSYLEYLWSLKNDGKTAEYLAALPDTAKWYVKGSYNTSYVDYYFRHPAYRNYPVVNVTKEQAENYCAWLTQVWRKNTGNNTIVFRLPKRSEFLRAANGNSMFRPYAWNSPYLRNGKGQHQCNFLAIDAGAITRDSITGELRVLPNYDGVASSLSDAADLTAPSKAYAPNEFGLYNLNGNVAEMVSDENNVVGGDWNSPGYDIQNQSKRAYKGAEPTTGFRPVMTFTISE